MAFCEQCGNQLNDNAKFCGKCGTPVGAVQEETPETGEDIAPAVCAQCGEPLEPGEAFCANCGAKVDEMPQQQYQQAAVQGQGEAVSDGEDEDEEILVMVIEDVFSISGRGPIVTGKIINDSIKLNDEVHIVFRTIEEKERLNEKQRQNPNYKPTVANSKGAVVTRIEMFSKLLDEAFPGDNVGLDLKGVKVKELKRGYPLYKYWP